MPSQDTLLIVVLVAIAANLILAAALLVIPRLRRRDRQRAAEFPAREAGPSSAVPAGLPRLDPRMSVPSFATVPPGQPDPETGLEVAATWNRWLREEDARIRRYRHAATIVLVEIEGLERLVERLGPEAANRLIPPVATTMRRFAREADRVARLGAGRFGAMLVETDEVQAINYVERIRQTCDLWLAAGAVTLRLSIGWAEASASRSVDLAFQAAEERLNTERHRDRGEAPSVDPAPNPSPAT